MHDDDEFDPDYKSKSQVKREMHALHDMGVELVALNTAQLDHLPLPERLRDAIDEARRIHQHGAHKRQLGFIAKVLRETDAEPIRHALDALLVRDRQTVARLHQLEKLRDQLIAEGDAALDDVLAQFPDIDRTRIRQLTREAQRELHQNKPPRAAREIFRYLRETAEATQGNEQGGEPE